jgi:hypothetical protein
MMATEVVNVPFNEVRAASTAGGGSALTVSTTISTPFLAGTNYAWIEGRNYSTAVVVKYALVPYLLVYKTADALATVTDYSEAAQDGSTGTDVVLSSLDTLANGDALWVGSHVPFRGVVADVDAANGTASVLTGTYWNGSALTDISLTDGTTSAGATFAVDGAITWTVPTDWVAAPLALIGSAASSVPFSGNPLYWVRLVVSAALDSSTTLNSLLARVRSTAYAELVTGRVVEMAVRRGVGGIVGVEATTDAGTANLIVNCAVRHGSRFL